jgi:cell wall-associated NlpC family hydrolase
MSVKKSLVVASVTTLTAALTLVSPAVATEQSSRKTAGRLDTHILVAPSPDMAYAIADQATAQETAHTQGTAYALAAKQATESRSEAVAVSRSQTSPQTRASEVPGWATAINWAQTRLGVPYVWGGDSMAEGGYDCSGLVMRAYEKAGIRLPRVANDQYAASSNHPRLSELRPGDLVFYSEGGWRDIHHVGIYVGGGQMIHAPKTGTVIRFDKIDYMSGYFGATRVS